MKVVESHAVPITPEDKKTIVHHHSSVTIPRNWIVINSTKFRFRFLLKQRVVDSPCTSHERIMHLLPVLRM